MLFCGLIRMEDKMKNNLEHKTENKIGPIIPVAPANEFFVPAKSQKLSQKILLYLIYGLLILMIIFSLMARKNLGEEGFNNCVQEKCAEKGPEFCSKFREINNCCEGAGGVTAQNEQGLSCQFG